MGGLSEFAVHLAETDSAFPRMLDFTWATNVFCRKSIYAKNRSYPLSSGVFMKKLYRCRCIAATRYAGYVRRAISNQPSAIGLGSNSSSHQPTRDRIQQFSRVNALLAKCAQHLRCRPIRHRQKHRLTPKHSRSRATPARRRARPASEQLNITSG